MLRLRLVLQEERRTLKKEVGLTCCGRVLREDFQNGRMVCLVCKKDYPLGRVRSFLQKAIAEIQGLDMALAEEE